MPAEQRHHYAATVTWTGNPGPGTTGHGAYRPDHAIAIAGKPDLAGSADPAFRGDPARHNPEDLFLASLAVCHMLWYLHLAAAAGLAVVAYSDRAEAVMVEAGADGGRFERVVLNPRVTIAAGGDVAIARRLHDDAHRRCFIANSVRVPIAHRAEIRVADG